MMLRKLIVRLSMVVLFFAGVGAAVHTYYGADNGKPSVCHGNAVNGSLENAKRLPYSGDNFRAYHIAGFLTGRTFMHGAVRDSVADAYAALAKSDAGLRFLYAESGWPWGGRFLPHKTHANGTSVDFMVPLRDAKGEPAELPASLFNKLGYDIRFDDKGEGGGLTIDYDAMAKHLLALDTAAKAHGIRVDRVIFEPPLKRLLLASPSGKALAGRVPFMEKSAWFRHDQHYHVDFAVACQ
jgi:penicillin-insensitive murein DD-endopeptidase